MVRLTCKNKNCNREWKETKTQADEDHVFCPKCGILHHSHTQPINPPKVIVTGKKPKVDVSIPQPIKPYEYKVWHQRGFEGRLVSMDPDKKRRRKTRKVAK